MSSDGPPSETEFGLLRSLSRPQLTPGQITGIAAHKFVGIDWAELVRLAEQHGVLSLIAGNLLDHATGLPTATERALSDARRRDLLRGLWFSSELARLIQKFEAAKIPVVPFKGPLLAHTIYGDLGLRGFSDLDFLVSPAHLERARHSLAAIDYKPSKDFTPAVDRFWLRNGYEQSFDGPAGKHLLELQWALLPRIYAVDLPVEALIGRCQKVVISGTEMRCLTPEDSLLSLSIHAAKHLWGRLIWLVDIAGAIRKENIDYDLLISNAKKFGVARMAAVSFWLVRTLLEEKISPVAEKMINEDSRVPELGALFSSRLARAATYQLGSAEYFGLILKLRERPLDRLRCQWRLLSTPGQADLDAVNLPKSLFPLYRIVRVGRLLRRGSRRSVRTSDQ